jgi:ribosome biogenesis SPOUT family RNA methylase Rps3
LSFLFIVIFKTRFYEIQIIFFFLVYEIKLRAALRRQNGRYLLTADLISLCQKTRDGRNTLGGSVGGDGNGGD